jgi:hypothetical protein
VVRNPRVAADRRTTDRDEGLSVHWFLHPITSLHDLLLGWGTTGVVLWLVACILVIAVPVILAVAMYVWWERKVLGWMHVRMGPNSIGPFGLAQTFADVFKLLLKETLIPAKSSNALFVIAPLISLAPAFAAWAVIPFDDKLVLANVNAGLLYLLAMTSMASTASASPAGRRIPSTRSLVRCVRPRRSSATKSRWAWRWLAC